MFRRGSQAHEGLGIQWPSASASHGWLDKIGKRHPLPNQLPHSVQGERATHLVLGITYDCQWQDDDTHLLPAVPINAYNPSG